MALALPLRAALKRGALVAAANWPVVLVQFASSSIYKLALAVPVVGGAFMVAVLLGTDVGALFEEGIRPAAALVLASLIDAPVALASFVVAVGLVAAGGGVVTFVVKAGTLDVLAAGERRSGELHRPPLRLQAVQRAAAFSIASFLAGTQRFGRRFVSLGLWLGVAYLAVAAVLLASVWITTRTRLDAAWPLVVLFATSVAVVAVTGINLMYSLLQVIVAADDCRLSVAWRRLRQFLIEDVRQVVGIFGVVLALVVLTWAVSLLATAGLALVAWVPFVGLAVVPLQLAAWLVRGLVFEYVELAALSAYLAQYRRFAEPEGRLVASPAVWEHSA